MTKQNEEHERLVAIEKKNIILIDAKSVPPGCSVRRRHEMRIAIGMDLHKSTAVCFAVYAGEGEPNDKNKEFIEKFNAEFRSQASTPGEMVPLVKALNGHEAWFLIENSTKTFEIYWVLTNLGCNVVVAQAQDLYRITKSVKKTDKNDSIELAAYLRRYLHGEREFAVCTMPPKEWMMRRELCRVLFKEKAHLGDLKKRARMHLLLHGIQLRREYSDIFCNAAMIEMNELRDPVLRILVAEAKEIKLRTDKEAKVIEHFFKDIEMCELIKSIPGFGSVSAAYLTSMIMDIDRFQNKNSFTAYFGVVPRVRESAETSHRCSTTHRGDEEIRRLVMQAAFVHVNAVDDSVVKRMWDRLKDRGMAHREVQCACARKLLTVVWSVLKNHKPYVKDEKLLRKSEEMSDILLEDGLTE